LNLVDSIVANPKELERSTKMITEACQQFPSAIMLTSRIYRVARPQKSTRKAGLACATIGTMLGVVFGVAIAATSTQPVGGTADGELLAIPVQESSAQTAENKWINSHGVDPRGINAMSTPEVLAVAAQPTGLGISSRKQSSGSHKSSVQNSLAISTTTRGSAPTAVPVGGTPADEDAALNLSFIVEGDATLADFDASAGTIETQDGRSFVLTRASGTNNFLPGQDDEGNIHYRCDQNRNCTLFHAGVKIPNARLTT
jgi:hypothetical protein